MKYTRTGMIDKPILSLSESLTPERRTAFYERHKPIAVAMIVLVFLLPFVGVFVYGLLGAAASVMVSAFGYYLTPYLMQRLGFRASP